MPPLRQPPLLLPETKTMTTEELAAIRAGYRKAMCDYVMGCMVSGAPISDEQFWEGSMDVMDEWLKKKIFLGRRTGNVVPPQ